MAKQQINQSQQKFSGASSGVANQPIPAATFTNLIMSASPNYDTDGYVTSSGFKAPFTGYYDVSVAMNFASGFPSGARVLFTINNGEVFDNNVYGGDPTASTVFLQGMKLTVGTTIPMQLFVSSAATCNFAMTIAFRGV